MKKNISSYKKVFLTACLLLFASVTIHAGRTVKREFRGAWIQCVNGQFLGMTSKQMQETLIYQLDKLKEYGVNAIIFQVRPECDALYKSELEPLPDRRAGTPARHGLGPACMDDGAMPRARDGTARMDKSVQGKDENH